MKKNKIYCVFCGAENKLSNKKCSQCKEKIDPKEHLFLDYLKEHINDDLSGRIQDNLFNIIINYIRSHLYGCILTISIIITTTAITNSNNINYEIVSTPPKEIACIPKNFDKKYSYVYETKEECIKQGNNVFIEVYETIDNTIFTYSCEQITDDCNKTWYGIYFNRWGEDEQPIKVYY